MKPDQAFFDSWAPRAVAVLRIVVAYLFLQHATAKFFGVPHVAMFDGLQLLSLLGAAGVIELIGGGLLLVGLYTRAAAFVLSGEMAVAYFMAHASQGHVLSPMLNQGEPAVLYSFIFLALSALGAGAWSVDSLRHHSGGWHLPTAHARCPYAVAIVSDLTKNRLGRSFSAVVRDELSSPSTVRPH